MEEERVCNTAGMQESFRDAVSEPEPWTLWSCTAQVGSETRPENLRSQEWAVSITVSHFPINLEEVTLNKQRCIFCSVASRNMALPSFSHGIHCSGEIFRSSGLKKVFGNWSWNLTVALWIGFFVRSDFKALHAFSLESPSFYFGSWVCILMTQKVWKQYENKLLSLGRNSHSELASNRKLPSIGYSIAKVEGKKD